MDHRKTYIEELIRKELLDSLTTEESKLLEAEKRHYSEEEYDRMVIEVLRQLEGQLPESPLDDWVPDYQEIQRKGDELRKQKETDVQVKQEREGIPLWLAWTAIGLMVLGISLYFVYTQEEAGQILRLDGDCMQQAGGTDIPLHESIAMVRGLDSNWMRVASEQAGPIMQVGDILVTRTEEGVLRLARTAHWDDETPKGTKVEIYTGPRQQCVIELEGGTRIRLNAQSYLSYPTRAQDTVYMDFSGEAYVDAVRGDRKRTLVIAAHKAKIIVRGANFVVKSTKQYTRTIIGAGELDMYAYSLKKALTLYCPGDFGIVRPAAGIKNRPARDTLVQVADQNMELALMWTKTVRSYKNIPLRVFVEEMSRWEGFTIKQWDCIPEDKRVTVSVCYRSKREELYGAIRKAGVLLYQEKGMLSFCPEDTEKRVVMSLLDVEK